MKLLLTSGGLMNKSIIQALRELCPKPFEDLRLGFIPTAANIEAGDKWWLIEDLETCKNLKFKSVDIIDISAMPQDLWLKRLEETDVIMIEGGCTYHLRYWIKKSGLESILPKLLEERVYIGISAGSVVVGPAIVPIESEKEAALQAGDEIIEGGLKYVDFLIEPHINSPYFPELTFGYVKKESESLKHTIYGLDDNSAIKVDGTKVTPVSEGGWQKFN